jgi:hypothetical protein
MKEENKGVTDDGRVMSAFQYKQELNRTIRKFGSFAVAFSFISITTGIFANYELVIDESGPAGIWTWPVVIVGQLLVALVFAELAAKIPLTGYSYQWVTRLGGNGWGWFTKSQTSWSILTEIGPLPEGQSYFPVWIMACLMVLIQLLDSNQQPTFRKKPLTRRGRCPSPSFGRF